MRQPVSSQPPIDPRSFLNEHGLEMFDQTLRANSRYVCQQRPLKAMAKSLRRYKPLYVAGKRGTGKTALAKAVVKAFNLPYMILQCMDDLSTGDILYEFDRTAQSEYVQQQLKTGVELKEARAAAWTDDFLSLGTVLEVYAYARTATAPPVLILDEVDKLSQKSRQKLLQVLDEQYATIPRLTPTDTVGIDGDTKHPPIVIMTSNNLDDNEASAPFRSRCYFVTVKEPTLAEKINILSTSVPNAPIELFKQVIRMMEFVSHQGSIIDKPEIREAKDLLLTLVDEGVEHLDREVIDDNICCLAKSSSDESNFVGLIVSMEKAAQKKDANLDLLVEQAYEVTRSLVRVGA